MRLLMTRPRADSERFVAQFDRDLIARLRPVVSPLLEIRPNPQTVDMQGIAGLVFTSANAVKIAADRVAGRNLPTYCVGPGTTETARSAGWNAVMAGRDAAELIGNLTAARPATPLLHLHGAHMRRDVAKALCEAGFPARGQVLYDQVLLPLDAQARAVLEGSEPVLVPLFSPRTAQHFAGQHAGAAPLFLAALSEQVAGPLRKLPYQELLVAPDADSAGMRKAVENLSRRSIRVEGRNRAH